MQNTSTSKCPTKISFLRSFVPCRWGFVRHSLPALLHFAEIYEKRFWMVLMQALSLLCFWLPSLELWALCKRPQYCEHWSLKVITVIWKVIHRNKNNHLLITPKQQTKAKWIVIKNMKCASLGKFNELAGKMSVRVWKVTTCVRRIVTATDIFSPESTGKMITTLDSKYKNWLGNIITSS